MTSTAWLDAEDFHLAQFQNARPFASFLPGIAGALGKPMWVFYTNRGQGISSFGVGNRDGAMLEFQPANKAYALTPINGFRTFLRITRGNDAALYEPFLPGCINGVTQRLTVRAAELQIEETHTPLGISINIAYFTLPGESLSALVRQVTLRNTGNSPQDIELLDGLPQIVPCGLNESLAKTMSRTMEAFAEVRHVEDNLPFYKLKVEPSDKPEVKWIEAGFFAFTLVNGQTVPVIADPDLVFGPDTSLRAPLAFSEGGHADAHSGRCETMTGCAFAQLTQTLAPGEAMRWDSYFGHAPVWEAARDFRERICADPEYGKRKRTENTTLVESIGAKFALIAGPESLDPYTRQAFLDNTLRGGLPVVVKGPEQTKIFHAFTRKHGDMERDYNHFELSATYWSQGSSNFRDVNQNRRSENFTCAGIDAANIETFFELLQLDGNNPLVIKPEKFRLPKKCQDLLEQSWPPAQESNWRNVLGRAFSPGELMEAMYVHYGNAPLAEAQFEYVVGMADKVQEADHGEGYWVDHWIYNLDLLESYSAMYPDRLSALLIQHRGFSYYDSEYVVQPRHKKYQRRADGSVRQLHAVIRDVDKAKLIARRLEFPNQMRTAMGNGEIYKTTLLGKIVNLVAVKTSLLDPFGIGLEMESEKPGWCDALNGLPGLFGSSTHEAFTLRRALGFLRETIRPWAGTSRVLSLPTEVATLVTSLTGILRSADPEDFFPSWQLLSAHREAFREEVKCGIRGTEETLDATQLLDFIEAADRVLSLGLAKAVNEEGLPISYYSHEVIEFDPLPQAPLPEPDGNQLAEQYVCARRFQHKPISIFLEGAVHKMRFTGAGETARKIYAAVRRSGLYDAKLGMYRMNEPLDAETFEIGRSRTFSPGWLENESVFLHMHYKYLLETLRCGLTDEFYADLQRGLVAFQDPLSYGRSPLENSSFICSSRFPDSQSHGRGFVARLSGATAEWISMVLHMGLGPSPFRVVDGLLRFEPIPALAEWLFTHHPTAGFAAHTFGLKLFGHTWIVYENPSRQSTYGPHPVKPTAFELRYRDGRRHTHQGLWLPADLALDLRNANLDSLVIQLG